MRRLAVLRMLTFAAVFGLLVFWVHRSDVRRRGAHAAAPAGRTLVFAQGSDMETMEPNNLNSASSVSIADLLWGRLLNITSTGEIVPSMASGYRWNESGDTITFHLRPGLKCGSGLPLTAHDVAFTLNRAADRRFGFYGNLPAFVYSAIGFLGASANNELDVAVHVRSYSSQVPGMLSQAYMLCQSDYQNLSPATAAAHPVATGPYRLVEWSHDDHILLARNPHYSLAVAPFDQVLMRVIPEASTRVAEVIAGNVDLISGVPPDQVATLNHSGTAHVQIVSGTRRIFIGFNFSSRYANTPGGAAIAKKRVRQALEYAIDVPTLCTQLLQQPCRRMSSPVQPERTHVAAYPYEPETAEHLLDAAGYPRGHDGVRFHLTLQTPRGRYLEDVNVAQAVSQYLGDVGVAITVEALDFNSVFAPRARQHQVGELFLSGNGGALWSELFDISLFPTVQANTNTGAWDSPAWRAGLHQLDNVRDPDAETAIVNTMLDVFRDEAPWLFLYFQPDFYANGPCLRFTPRRDELIDVMAMAPQPCASGAAATESKLRQR